MSMPSVADFRRLCLNPPRTPGTLGADPASASSVDLANQLGDYALVVADGIDAASALLQNEYDLMRDYAASLDIPLLGTGSLNDLGMPTTWTKDLDQQYVDLQHMAMAASIWLREAADGQRPFVIAPNGWGLQAMPEDTFRIDFDKTSRELVMIGAQPQTTQGTGVGAVPALIAVAAIAGAAVNLAILGAYLYIAYTAISGLINIIRDLVNSWNISKVYNCLDQHTPAECQAAMQGLTDQTKARAGLENPATVEGNKPGDWANAIGKGLLWIGLAAGVAYVGVKVVPPLFEAKAMKGARA